MKVSETTARAWMESLTGCHGLTDSCEMPNSIEARSFLAGALGGCNKLPYWVSMSNMRNSEDATRFLSFIEGVAAIMRAEGIKGIDDDAEHV